MSLKSTHILALLAFLLHAGFMYGQGNTDCPSPTFYKTFGDEFQSEYATSIIRSNDNNFFLAGRNGNRTFIQKMNPSGVILWTRDFQLGPFDQVTPSEIIQDSDGMIVGIGTQGAIGLSKSFIFRYDPVNNVMLWAHQITSNNPVTAGILERGPGDMFVIYQNSLLINGDREAEVIQVDRLTGAINTGLARRYNYSVSDQFSKLVHINGSFYVSGTTEYGETAPYKTRHLLGRLDDNNLEPVWMQLSHRDTLAAGNFFGRDLLVDGDSLVSLYAGPSATTNDTIYLQKTDLTGNIAWVRRYNILGDIHKLLSVSDGYVIYGQQNDGQHIVIKTDKQGLPLWGRIHVQTGATFSNPVSPHLAVAMNDSLYFTGVAASGNSDIFLWKLLSDGSMVDSCGYMDTLAVQSVLVSATRSEINLNHVFSTAISAPASPALQETSLLLNQFCPDCSLPPDPCPEGNDLVISIDDIFCNEGSVTLKYTICDIDGGAVPPVRVTFFDGNPYSDEVNVLGSYQINPSTTDSCFSVELPDIGTRFGVDNVFSGAQFFAVVNVPANVGTPLNLDEFPFTNLEECDYTNNGAGASVNFPASPTLNIGPDLTVCPNSGAMLDAGPGFFRYRWSNGDSISTTTINFSGQYRVTVTDVCGFRQVDTVEVVVLQAPSVTENGSFCPGQSVTIRGFEFAQAGIFQRTIDGLNADCDTVATFFITQLPYQARNEIVRFCPGESVTINGIVYSESGLAIDTLASSVGCDTIVSYFLNQLPAPFRFDTAYICPGDSVLVGNYYYSEPGLVFDTIYANGPIGCDTIIRVNIYFLPQPTINELVEFCPGSSVTIRGEVYTEPGELTFTLPATSGCDTLLKYTLEWLPVPTRSDTVGFCQGDTLTINGNIYTEPGSVEVTLPGQNGECDTILTYVLEYLPAPTREETVQFCPGTSVEIGGNFYTDPGTVIITVAGVSGECDTVVTYTLEFLPAPSVLDTLRFCPGTSVEIDGNVYTQPGTVTATIPGTGGGCDTLVTYTLEFLPAPTKAETVAFCPGSSIIIDGTEYTQPGTVESTIPATGGGCDTLVTYTLEFLPAPTLADTILFCPGTSVQIGGDEYTQPGTVTTTIPGTGGGCDTLATYELQWLPYNTASESISFCPGQSVVIGGNAYTQPGTVLDTIPSVTGGCDTVVTYTLTFSNLPTSAQTVEFCEGTSITLGGQTYTQPGTVTVTVPGAAGACDTVVTYTLVFVDPLPSTLSVTCPSNVNIITTPGTGPIPVNYAQPTAASDCTCPGIAWTITQGGASGSIFQPGTTKVCYTAKDSCGSTASCCFDVIVREEGACDTKVNGCMKYELLSITADTKQRYTYRIKVTNSCAAKMLYTNIQLPDGVVADSPLTNSIFESVEGTEYLVRNPNYSPFYSIRFKSLNDSISNGESSILEYTLPAQVRPTFIHIGSRLAPQLNYEAHLNVFNCPIGVTQTKQERDDASEATQTLYADKTVFVFPNPSSGLLYADFSDWQGSTVDVKVLDSRGQRVQFNTFVAGSDAQLIQLPESLPGGLYFLEVLPENGEKQVIRFVLAR